MAVAQHKCSIARCRHRYPRDHVDDFGIYEHGFRGTVTGNVVIQDVPFLVCETMSQHTSSKRCLRQWLINISSERDLHSPRADIQVLL